MGKRTKVETRSSSPTWETLRDWLRGKIREWMQGLLEEEVTGFLGRARYEKRASARWWWRLSLATGSRWRAGRRCCGTCGSVG